MLDRCLVVLPSESFPLAPATMVLTEAGWGNPPTITRQPANRASCR